MPRNISGTYSLPVGAFVSGTTILSASMNANLSDIATALTQSLATTGVSTMTAPIIASVGAAGAPSYAFTTSPSTGFFLSSPGVIGVSGTIAGTVSGLGAIPVGTITDFAGATPPTGWYLCYGQAVSRTTYSALFAIIGTTYGAGNGTTTFNLPDCRGYVTAGVGNMGGTESGRINTYVASGLSNTGGVQNIHLVAGNIPSLAYSGTTGNENANHAHTSLYPTFGDTSSGPGYGYAGGGTLVTRDAGDLNEGTSNELTVHGHSFSGTVGSGSPSAAQIVQPTIEFNKIIFAGV